MLMLHPAFRVNSHTSLHMSFKLCTTGSVPQGQSTLRTESVALGTLMGWYLARVWRVLTQQWQAPFSLAAAVHPTKLMRTCWISQQACSQWHLLTQWCSLLLCTLCRSCAQHHLDAPPASTIRSSCRSRKHCTSLRVRTQTQSMLLNSQVQLLLQLISMRFLCALMPAVQMYQLGASIWWLLMYVAQSLQTFTLFPQLYHFFRAHWELQHPARLCSVRLG